MTASIQVHSQTRARVPSIQEAHAARAIQERLDRFGSSVIRASVHFQDALAARGGTDTVCSVRVMLRGREQVVVEERAHTAREAVELVADDVERAVGESVAARARGRRERGNHAQEREAGAEEAPARHKTHPSMRHAKDHHPRATSAYEPIETASERPSRKSTRGSANRSKRDTNLALRHGRALRAPTARATRAQATASRIRGASSSAA